MNQENLSTKKRIGIAALRPGMYIVGLDRSWLQTPFLFHRKLLHRPEEIDQLKKHGIREVVIDTARGADVEDPAAVHPETIGEAAKSPPEVSPAAAQTPAQPAPPANPQGIHPIARELENARAIHQDALVLAQSIFDGVGVGTPIDAKIAARVVSNLQESIGRSPEANLLLMQMRRFQKDLYTHAVNVCVLSLVVATTEALGDDMDALGMGALFHDIGETRLPRSLLHKTSDLTDAEAKMLRQHPSFGVALLAQADGVGSLAKRIVRDHHERIDGSGYPAGSGGADLSVQSQIVALTDSYDDMLSGRNQSVLQPTEVLRQLYLQANSGSADRDLVEKVIRSLGVYPIGSLVELNTGERGMVISTNRASALKPTVRVIVSRSGLVQYNGPIVSLADSPGDGSERRIVAVLDPGKERIDPMVFMRLAQGAPG